MKKIYLIAFVTLSIVFSVNSQTFDDDIESYPLGPIHTSPWTSWDETPGTQDDISVSDEQAHSGSQSILVAEGGVIDGVLELGNQTSGTWYLDFYMYIPSGKSGYFNIQNTMPVGTQWNFHAAFNEGGADEGGLTLYDASGENQGPGTALGTGFYTPDTWFRISLVINLDDLLMDAYIDGIEIVTGTTYTGNTLGALNLYSNESGGESNRYYIDDARFDTTPLSTETFSANAFNVYPNPVQDRLSIQSQDVVDQVAIYNVLGKLVYQGSPNIVSPSVDMSNFNSGVYFVEVTIGNASKTVKVIK